MSEPLKPKVVAFVPAKGSSERIENKNAKLLDGRPLVVHTLDKLLKCRNVDDVFLDTESDEIAKLARHLPVQIMKRNRFLASNGTDGGCSTSNQASNASVGRVDSAAAAVAMGATVCTGSTVTTSASATRVSAR